MQVLVGKIDIYVQAMLVRLDGQAPENTRAWLTAILCKSSMAVVVDGNSVRYNPADGTAEVLSQSSNHRQAPERYHVRLFNDGRGPSCNCVGQRSRMLCQHITMAALAGPKTVEQLVAGGNGDWKKNVPWLSDLTIFLDTRRYFPPPVVEDASANGKETDAKDSARADGAGGADGVQVDQADADAGAPRGADQDAAPGVSDADREAVTKKLAPEVRRLCSSSLKDIKRLLPQLPEDSLRSLVAEVIQRTVSCRAPVRIAECTVLLVLTGWR